MKRDTVKTIAGLIIIGGIVVATFLYGNSQRQAQLAHDQQVKQQQTAKIPAKSSAAQPSATGAAGASATNNTAPVNTPASNTIQGSAAQSSTSKSAATTTPAVAGSTNTPVTGGSGEAAPLPTTGPEMAGILGLGSITAMVMAVRGSRRAMLRAARTRR